MRAKLLLSLLLMVSGVCAHADAALQDSLLSSLAAARELGKPLQEKLKPFD